MNVRARLALVLFGTAAIVYALDRFTKLWAESRLAGRDPIELIPRALRLRYVENSGGAFSLFGGQPWLFFTASLVVVAVIVYLSARLHSRVSAVGLGLILGGAVGNLTDRIVRGPGVSGKVIDWIEFPRVWPVFNVADAAIVTGALLMVVWSVFHRPDREPAVRPAGEPAGEP